jgi:hypothetical protein
LIPRRPSPGTGGGRRCPAAPTDGDIHAAPDHAAGGMPACAIPETARPARACSCVVGLRLLPAAPRSRSPAADVAVDQAGEQCGVGEVEHESGRGPLWFEFSPWADRDDCSVVDERGAVATEGVE